MSYVYYLFIFCATVTMEVQKALNEFISPLTAKQKLGFSADMRRNYCFRCKKVQKNSASCNGNNTGVWVCAVESRGVALSDISGRPVDTN